jgi:hypothetical protein
MSSKWAVDSKAERWMSTEASTATSSTKRKRAD